MSENEPLFPVSTPQAIFELPKLYHSAVLASIFVHPHVTVNVISTGTSRTILPGERLDPTLLVQSSS